MRFKKRVISVQKVRMYCLGRNFNTTTTVAHSKFCVCFAPPWESLLKHDYFEHLIRISGTDNRDTKLVYPSETTLCSSIKSNLTKLYRISKRILIVFTKKRLQGYFIFNFNINSHMQFLSNWLNVLPLTKKVDYHIM